MSHGAVSRCLLKKIPVLYLSTKGHYFGRLQTAGLAQVSYLVQQVERSQDPEFVRRNAIAIVQAKLHNSRLLLKRLNAKRKLPQVVQIITDMERLTERAGAAETVESLLGYEGQGAHLYFQGYGALIKEPFVFTDRNRRPPKDPVNSLLSLGYTLLSQNIPSMVEIAGLHSHFGNLHTPRNNHPALVSDLMEEFRAPVVDSVVAYVVNSKLLTPEDFTPPDAKGGVYLHPDALKRFLRMWEERLLSTIQHPHTKYKVSHRRCFELQVWEYIRMFDVPYNPLHERGFTSIGCEPCTRAIKPGEPERAGRWWWEQDERRECGLHLSASVSGSRAQGQPRPTAKATASAS